ncbi:TPA: hypothetical protein ACNV29_004448 [Klebsiella oxytoca]|uniref:Nucleotidyltransferase n=1 Tax=Lelliottia nimipressuralis TaxID=69220 RepID=A0ABD4K4W7_9ENTR|nr:MULTISPECIES: hypothetical protein [Enterobacteriaceae]MBF4176527.1 hypothetical protein [Lelliottia nimipressuralis]MEB7996312.1 hypothetical protein [Raoultella ornithinolytica]HCH7886400.1 hypothetical protein [Raoultella ornithinolytica]
MVVHTKPKDRSGYSAVNTEMCERVLVTLLTTFGTMKGTLRLIGGLVPRYLTPAQEPLVPEHFGTSDVDIVLNLQVIAEGENYASLHDQLVERGFRKHSDTNAWRWEFPIPGGSPVLVEFLQGNNAGGKPGKEVPIDGEAVSALVIPFAEMSYDWYAEKKIAALLFGDKGQGDAGIVFETIRFADEVVFILLKAISFQNRNEPKDAADLIHVMRYAGAPEDIADKFLDHIKTGKHQTAIETGLNALQICFAEGNDNVEGYLLTGPVRYGQFLHGTDASLEDERVRDQRFAAGLVTEVLRLIEEGRN